MDVALGVPSLACAGTLRVDAAADDGPDAPPFSPAFSVVFASGVLDSRAPDVGFASADLSSEAFGCPVFWVSGAGETPFLPAGVGARGCSGAGDCFLGGALICDEMIAGSTGAPLTVDWAVGALFAGGVYRFSRPPADRGGNSCRRTPLYLLRDALGERDSAGSGRYELVLFVVAPRTSTNKIHDALLSHMGRDRSTPLNLSDLALGRRYSLLVLRMVLVDGGRVDVLVVIRLQAKQPLVLRKLVPVSTAG